MIWLSIFYIYNDIIEHNYFNNFQNSHLNNSWVKELNIDINTTLKILFLNKPSFPFAISLISETLNIKSIKYQNIDDIKIDISQKNALYLE